MLIALLKPMLRLLVVLSLLLHDSVFAASTRDWEARSIYQVFTDRFARTDGSTSAPCNPKNGISCGGTWRGIIDHLDYIQGMGFDAIMISPVTQNIKGSVEYGDAHHGYWPQNLYELNENFGTREDLLDLVRALHKRDMYLMTDIIINNMAYMSNGRSPSKAVDYSSFVPFNNEKYFHPYCEITDYKNYELAQKCWTGDKVVTLPDLNTEDDAVTQMMETWINGFVANYSIDGLRIDAAKHVNTEYLARIVDASGVFATGEVYESNQEMVCNYQNYIPSVPNFPLYYAMIEAFGKGNMSALVKSIEHAIEVCDNTFALGAFSENHDLPRFPSYTKDTSVSKAPSL